MPIITAAPAAEAGADSTARSRAPRSGPPRRSRVLALVAVLAALVAAAASTEENEPARVDESEDTGDTAQPEEFAVGDLVELGDWRVRVHGVTDPVESTNSVITPAPGTRWVAVDAEVTNAGTEPQAVSSLLCFELVDDQNRSYTLTITGEEGPAPPDGEVAPGASRRGTMTYEVPADAAGLRMTFQCDLLSTGSATIALG